jgi:predicted nucleic acid-binding protein
MTDIAFCDTNILGYAVDCREHHKQKKAVELLESLKRSRSGVLSTQVLQEFYNIATKKLDILPLEAKKIVHDYSKLKVISISPNLIENAIDISIDVRISFWDALIVSAAEEAGCSVIYSEDLNNGQTIRGMKIINPFG